MTFSLVLLLLLLVIVLVVKLIFGYYLQITLPEILVPQFQVQFEIYRYVLLRLNIFLLRITMEIP